MILTVAFLSLVFHCVAGQYANEQDVLDAFTDVYDIMYAIRDDHAKQIRELKANQAKEIQKLIDKDLKKTEELEFLKVQIEELQKMTAPATCSELWNQGVTRDQELYLDSDGVNKGEKPVKGFCTYPSNEITFGEEIRVNISHCEDADCFQSDPFQSDSATLNQIQSVIETSTVCTQKWAFNCISAPLKQPSDQKQLLFWKDNSGNAHQLRPSGTSKCDEKSIFLETDEGVIDDKTKLPILGISYGHFLYGVAEIVIGPLTCSSDQNRFNIRDTVEHLVLQIQNANESQINLEDHVVQLGEKINHFNESIENVIRAAIEDNHREISEVQAQVGNNTMDIEIHIQCDPNPCFNNGKCEAFTNDLEEAGYRCICSVGVTGDVCQHDISRSLTDNCPGQGLFVFNEENKDEIKEIVISPYVNWMNCWWYISNTLDTGHIELSFSNFESEGGQDYLQVLNGSSTNSPELHKLSGILGSKKITWTDSFVSIYWYTDVARNYAPMTGYLSYKP